MSAYLISHLQRLQETLALEVPSETWNQKDYRVGGRRTARNAVSDWTDAMMYRMRGLFLALQISIKVLNLMLGSYTRPVKVEVV